MKGRQEECRGGGGIQRAREKEVKVHGREETRMRLRKRAKTSIDLPLFFLLFSYYLPFRSSPFPFHLVQTKAGAKKKRGKEYQENGK